MVLFGPAQPQLVMQLYAILPTIWDDATPKTTISANNKVKYSYTVKASVDCLIPLLLIWSLGNRKRPRNPAARTLRCSRHAARGTAINRRTTGGQINNRSSTGQPVATLCQRNITDQSYQPPVKVVNRRIAICRVAALTDRDTARSINPVNLNPVAAVISDCHPGRIQNQPCLFNTDSAG